MDHEQGPESGAHAEYLAQRVLDALVHDPQVGELGISVVVVGDQVYLRGDVATLERRETVGRVAARQLPHHRVRNEVRVASWSEADHMEMLP